MFFRLPYQPIRALELKFSSLFIALNFEISYFLTRFKFFLLTVEFSFSSAPYYYYYFFSPHFLFIDDSISDLISFCLRPVFKLLRPRFTLVLISFVHVRHRILPHISDFWSPFSFFFS